MAPAQAVAPHDVLVVEPDYRGFFLRETEADLYVSYQGKYRAKPKECEKVTLGLIRDRAVGPGRLLDVGCSTGNFVRFLHGELPAFEFTGVDLMPQAIAEANRDRPERTEFHTCDFLRGRDYGKDWSASAERPVGDHDFDFVTFQTVVYALTDVQFKAALQRAHDALRPGGFCVLFDLFHPFEGHYQVIEKSVLHPNGHPIYMRPLSQVRDLATGTGFEVAEVRKFTLPSDLLPAPYDPHDLTSYVDGGHIMRGPLSQPFCHVVLKSG